MLVMVIAAHPGHASAQHTTIRSCEGPACAIAVERILTLGDLNGGPGFVGQPISIVRLSDGSFVVADRYDQDRIKRYAADGSFVAHVGRRGRGPGEYEVVQRVTALPGDTIEVTDLRQSRTTILDPSWRVVRTIQQDPIVLWGLVRFRDGSRVVMGAAYDERRVGLPLHVIGADGTYINSFGANPPVQNLRTHHPLYRQIAAATDSTVWSAHLTRYRVEEWSRSGRMLRAIQRDVPWFRPHDDYGYRGDDQPPNAVVRAVYQDTTGLLLTLVIVADTRWRDGLGTRKNVYGHQVRGIVDEDLYYDTLIEVIDTRTNRVVGMARLDQVAWGFTNDGLVYGYTSADSEPSIPIWRVRLNTDR